MKYVKCNCGTELIAYEQGDGKFGVKCVDCGFVENGVNLLFPVLIPEGVLVVGRVERKKE
jgi:hypothetical protein